MLEQILVPDVGEAEDVEVVELLVAVGDVIDTDTSLVVLESDKASMEIPSPCAGTIKSFAVAEGDKVTEGSLLAEIEIEVEIEIEIGEKTDTDELTQTPAPGPAEELVSAPDSDTSEPLTLTPQKMETSNVIPVPDVGDAKEIIVAEVLVRQGDTVAEGDSIVILESDKASMEIPTDLTGIVLEIFINEGDEVREGDPLITIVGQRPIERPAQSANESANESA